jgi:hypothetical protein
VHDPEKWGPVFGKDHASTKGQTMMAIQRKAIMVWRSTLCEPRMAAMRFRAIER